MKKVALIIMLCSVAIAAPLFSDAQSDNSATLEFSPQIPQANTDYSIKVIGTNTGRSTIIWFVDGIEKKEFKNQNSINLTAGDLGKSTAIDARVTFVDGSVLDAKQTIHPNRVDLIISADTTAPPFYQGRKLPSNGSIITATAHIFSQAGKAQGSYSYLWKLNGKVQNGGALLGKNTISFSSLFDTSMQVSVDILNTSGQLIAQKSQVVPIVKPEVFFYEENPLRGLSTIVLPNPNVFIGDEMTLKAVGYFMASSLTPANTFTEWKINNKTVASDATSNNEITLSKQSTIGKATLSYKIVNLKQVLQNAEQSSVIQF